MAGLHEALQALDADRLESTFHTIFEKFNSPEGQEPLRVIEREYRGLRDFLIALNESVGKSMPNPQDAHHVTAGAATLALVLADCAQNNLLEGMFSPPPDIESGSSD